MKLLLITPEQVNELDNINNSVTSKWKKVIPVEGNDGNMLLNADILDDCTPRGTWNDYVRVLDIATKVDGELELDVITFEFKLKVRLSVPVVPAGELDDKTKK